MHRLFFALNRLSVLKPNTAFSLDMSGNVFSLVEYTYFYANSAPFQESSPILLTIIEATIVLAAS